MHRSLGDFYCNSEFCCATRRTHLPTDVFRPKATTPSLRDSLALYGDSPRRRVATSTYEAESKLGSNFPQNSPNYTRHVLSIHLSFYSIPHEGEWMDNWLRIKRKKNRKKITKGHFPDMDL